MDFTNYAKYNKVLNLPEDASLHELDGRYFDAVEYWTVQGRRGDENAKAELQLIDEAYGALFQRHLKEQEGVENWKANYTMQQVVTGQERMTKPSEADDDLWVPPRRQRSASPEVEDGMETDELEGYEKEQSTADEVGPVSSFTIREITGDIKDAPDNAVIVHAVNCQGVWGYGIAKELKSMCPEAFETYRLHCQRATGPRTLIGTCLLIPPQPYDYERARTLKLKGIDNALLGEITIPKPRRWIACLFTSIGYGRPNKKTNNPGKDSPSLILQHTRLALEELRTRLEDYAISDPKKMKFLGTTAKEAADEKPGEIWSSKFNSGAFGVDWEVTREVLVQEFDTFGSPWTLVQKIRSGEDESLESPDANVMEDTVSKHIRRHSQIEFENRPSVKNGGSVECDRPLRDALREMGFL